MKAGPRGPVDTRERGGWKGMDRGERFAFDFLGRVYKIGISEIVCVLRLELSFIVWKVQIWTSYGLAMLVTSRRINGGPLAYTIAPSRSKGTLY